MKLRVVVLNLRRRPDRLTAFDQRWQAAQTGLRYRVHEAVDLADGTAACLASHQQILDTYRGPLLILEDDACFAPDFTLTVTPPPDWQIAWLAGQHRTHPTPVCAGWVRPRFLVRTHGYIVRNPLLVGAFLREAKPTRLDPVIAALPLPQYALERFTIGQTAGRSDIDGRIRHHDEYWNDLSPHFHPVTGSPTGFLG